MAAPCRKSYVNIGRAEAIEGPDVSVFDINTRIGRELINTRKMSDIYYVSELFLRIRDTFDLFCRS